MRLPLALGLLAGALLLAAVVLSTSGSSSSGPTELMTFSEIASAVSAIKKILRGNNSKLRNLRVQTADVDVYGQTQFEGLPNRIAAIKRVSQRIQSKIAAIRPLRGPRGFRGDVGPRGDRGSPGKTGPRGVPGAPGADGAPGPMGNFGANGVNGRPGQNGVPGARGPTGPRGVRGRVGPTGKTGERGPTGPQGPPGQVGPRGRPGLPGTRGSDGPVGLRGPNGPRGFAGPRGFRGKQGPRGPPGLTGRPGMDGRRGPMGPPGFEGPRGVPGLKGRPGLRGPQGPMGAPGPQGPRGSMGQQGIQGVRGPFGRRGPRGPAGTDANDGVPGRNGRNGTPGRDGVPGPRGPVGKPGAMGPRGQRGRRGRRGREGPSGERGKPGGMGPAGFNGAPGPRGARGSDAVAGRIGRRSVRRARGKPSLRPGEMICKTVRVYDWRNVAKQTVICSGQKKITAESVQQYKVTADCPFPTDRAGVRMDNKGRIQAFYRDHCAKNEAVGRWVKGKNYSTARWKRDSTLAEIVLPSEGKCRRVHIKGFKGKLKKKRICPGQTIWTARSRRRSRSGRCPYRRSKSGAEMNNQGQIRAVYRDRCVKNIFYGPFRPVGLSVVKFGKKETTVRLPPSTRKLRLIKCRQEIARAYTSVLRRAADPASARDYRERCMKRECDYACVVRELKETEEYKEVQRRLRRNLAAGSKIQSGELWAGYYEGNWGLLGGGGERTTCRRVNFRKAFSRAPRVQLAMNSFDMDRGPEMYRVRVEPRNIGTNGFDACFITWADSKVYSISLNWIAIRKRLRGVELGVVSSQAGTNHPNWFSRSESTDVNLRKNIPAPAVWFGFYHLDMWQRRNQRINTYVTDVRNKFFRMHFDTWADSKNWQLKNSYVAFNLDRLRRKNLDLQLGTFVPTGAIQPRLWNWNFPGERIYDHCIRFNKAYPRVPAVAIGMINLDTFSGDNIRSATRVHSVTREGFCVRFWSWWTSRTWSMGVSWVSYAAE